MREAICRYRNAAISSGKVLRDTDKPAQLLVPSSCYCYALLLGSDLSSVQRCRDTL